MNEQKERGDDSGSEIWTSSWEQQCLDELDSEPNLDERLPQERQFAADELWHSFQDCASAVTHLYKLERLSSPANALPLWLSFQNAASTVTKLYRDSLEAHRKTSEFGTQIGHQRRTRDVVSWVKKRRRYIKREDLLAFLCGKAPPPRIRASPMGRNISERGSPRSHTSAHDVGHAVDATDDLQPFREALALQGLNGAMANVGVSQSPPHHSHSRRRHGNVLDLFPDELFAHPDSRKRNNSSTNDVHMDSPSHKRNRLL